MPVTRGLHSGVQQTASDARALAARIHVNAVQQQRLATIRRIGPVGRLPCRATHHPRGRNQRAPDREVVQIVRVISIVRQGQALDPVRKVPIHHCRLDDTVYLREIVNAQRFDPNGSRPGGHLPTLVLDKDQVIGRVAESRRTGDQSIHRDLFELRGPCEDPQIGPVGTAHQGIPIVVSVEFDDVVTAVKRTEE